MKKLMNMTVVLAIMAIAPFAFADGDAFVQVIHNSPDPLAASVDIWLNSDLALEDVAYRSATGVLTLPADTDIVIGIAAAGSDDPSDIIRSFPVNLPVGSMTVVMATGVLDATLPGNPEAISTEFTLLTNELVTVASGGNVGLLAYHGAPDAPTVDVVAAGVGVLVDDLQFKMFQGYLEVPAGAYTLQITPGGDNSTILFSYDADLSGLGGGTAVVFASGYLDDLSFGLFAALNDGTVIQLPETPVSTQSSTWGNLKSSYN